MAGLITDYSKSPIKPKNTSLLSDPPASIPGASDHSFVPAAIHQTNPYQQHNNALHSQFQAPPKPTIDYGAPPRRSLDVRKSSDLNDTQRPSPTSDTHIRDEAQPRPSPTSPYAPSSNPAAGSSYYTPTSSHRPQQQQQYGSQPSQTGEVGVQGYQQNPIHDGGSTEYATDNQTSLEIAEQAWSSATKSVGEFAENAGETVGNAWKGGLGGLKSWLNPESKGMH